MNDNINYSEFYYINEIINNKNLNNKTIRTIG